MRATVRPAVRPISKSVSQRDKNASDRLVCDRARSPSISFGVRDRCGPCSAHAKKALLEGAPHGEEWMREGTRLANELVDARWRTRLGFSLCFL